MDSGDPNKKFHLQPTKMIALSLKKKKKKKKCNPLYVLFDQDPPISYGDIDVWIVPYSKSMETINYWGMAKFSPRGVIGTNFKEDHWPLPHTKYQSCGVVVSEMKIFNFLPLKRICCHGNQSSSSICTKTSIAAILAVWPKFCKLAFVLGHVICKSLIQHLNFKTKYILTVLRIQMHRRPMLILS